MQGLTVRQNFKKILFFRRIPELEWLFRCRDERMDATLDIYDSLRRKFHLARYDFAQRYVEGKCVADIACSTGYGAEVLARDGNAVHIAGVDIDAKAIRYAKAMHHNEKIAYLCSTGDSLGLDEKSMDVVVSFETIEHVEDDKKLLEEFSRILKHDGLLICSTPNDWPLECAEFHTRTYDFDSLVDVLESHFDVLEIYNQNSGSDNQFNRGMPAGIELTTQDNQSFAECYIAVCKKR